MWEGLFTKTSMLSWSLRWVTVFWIRLLYEAFPAGLEHLSPLSTRQHTWSVGPRESSSPVLNPFISTSLVRPSFGPYSIFLQVVSQIV